jgi:hypothetical protein
LIKSERSVELPHRHTWITGQQHKLEKLSSSP